MAELTKIVFEWSYSPKDFFEEKVELKSGQYELVLDDGKITATMDASVYDHDPSIREQLSEQLEDRFLGAQLVSRKSYKLSGPVVYRTPPNNRIEGSLNVTLGALSSVGTIDVIIRDAAGNIISDSKQERLQRRERFVELAVKYRRSDAVASGILLSYNTSLRDPDNELVHLYEIRDALARRFGGDRNARRELSISDNQWSRLGRLANAEPIKQGRHRGEYVGALRDATPDELNEARSIAIQMIEEYLEYLERNSP